jgi:hypothetical protein
MRFGRDSDGRLRSDRARLSVAAVNEYRGREIPNHLELGLAPHRVYRLFRPTEELRKSAASFAGQPVLLAHDENAQVVGAIGSDVRYLHPFLVGDLAIWDRDAIQGVRSGRRRQISLGYHYVPVMKPGWHAGSYYDGLITQIEGIHAALVPNGRAGAACAL